MVRTCCINTVLPVGRNDEGILFDLVFFGDTLNWMVSGCVQAPTEVPNLFGEPSIGPCEL